jgi:hypothetical protein
VAALVLNWAFVSGLASADCRSASEVELVEDRKAVAAQRGKQVKKTGTRYGCCYFVSCVTRFALLLLCEINEEEAAKEQQKGAAGMVDNNKQQKWKAGVKRRQALAGYGLQKDDNAICTSKAKRKTSRLRKTKSKDRP